MINTFRIFRFPVSPFIIKPESLEHNSAAVQWYHIPASLDVLLKCSAAHFEFILPKNEPQEWKWISFCSLLCSCRWLRFVSEDFGQFGCRLKCLPVSFPFARGDVPSNVTVWHSVRYRTCFLLFFHWPKFLRHIMVPFVALAVSWN